MAGTITCKVDDVRFGRMLTRYLDLFGQNAQEIVRTQTRLLLKKVVSFTPPKNLAQGRAAVARDINRAMTPIDLNSFPDLRMRQRVAELGLKGDTAGLQAIFSNSDSWKVWRIKPFSEDLHRRARSSRGRVLKMKHVFIPAMRMAMKTNIATRIESFRFVGKDGPSWQRYVKKMQGFVGRLRAAWGPAYERVGGVLPAWVKKHSDPHGTVDDRIYVRNNPSITIRNFAVGVGQLQNAFRGAMDSRAKAMMLDIRRKLRDAGRKAKFAA